MCANSNFKKKRKKESLNSGTLHQWMKLPPKENGLLSKNLSAKHRLLYYPISYWSERPRTTQGIAAALGCPPEPDGKTILLRTPHTSFAGHREISLDQATLYLLASFHSDGRCCAGCWGEKTAAVLPNTGSCMLLQYQPSR